MALISLEKIKDLIFRFKKFLGFLVYQLLHKKLKVKSVLRKFELLFKTLEIKGKLIPWIPVKAKLWLDKILKPDMIIYEYGSGISTLYFSIKVKQIISVEHNKSWYNNINDEILKKKIDNCEYYLIEPEYNDAEKSKFISINYRSGLKEYSKSTFNKYVESIDKYPDKYFDLVFIDGRARLGCIIHSINKIKLGGYLVLDNSDEIKYNLTQKILKKYEKLEFFGIAPENPYKKLSKISFWKASAWIIK
jgi:hypothetical protein